MDERKEIDWTMRSILETPAPDLAEMAASRFYVQAPLEIATTEDMEKAQKIMGACVANYAYLAEMSERLKVHKREVKRNGGSKEDVEEAMSKEEIFSVQADITKMTYNAVSRMITVRKMIMDEIRMTPSA